MVKVAGPIRMVYQVFIRFYADARHSSLSPPKLSWQVQEQGRTEKSYLAGLASKGRRERIFVGSTDSVVEMGGFGNATSRVDNNN
jgi:hypothetical protein